MSHRGGVWPHRGTIGRLVCGGVEGFGLYKAGVPVSHDVEACSVWIPLSKYNGAPTIDTEKLHGEDLRERMKPGMAENFAGERQLELLCKRCVFHNDEGVTMR